MLHKILNFKSVLQLLDFFKESETCKAALAELRWDKTPVCPHCDKTGSYVTKRGFRCTNEGCRKDFTVTTKSIFENSKIPLRTWFAAIYLISAHRKGISSHQLARDLNVTQKTAWFLLHRIRETLIHEGPELLDSIVEVDETYIGGKISNMTLGKRAAIKHRYGHTHKTAVLGLIERNGRLITKVVYDAKKTIVLPILKNSIATGSTIYTDSAHMYKSLKKQYKHEVVNHEQNEYVRGAVHTNTIEGAWGLLKRGIYGIYHQTSPKHLHRYVNEFTYRYNARKQSDCVRFACVVAQCSGKRLKYEDLISEPVN